jgi:hypothetical protein
MIIEERRYTCDYCNTAYFGERVFLKGVTGTSGGILMPELYHKRDFCSSVCFWWWTKKSTPGVKIEDDVLAASKEA